jgi:tRNA-(ms[2]io[6]A)-hydroxylase
MRAICERRTNSMLSAEITQLLSPVKQFLQCETPAQWLVVAAKPQNLPLLLQDHLICELNDNMCNYKYVSNKEAGR